MRCANYKETRWTHEKYVEKRGAVWLCRRCRKVVTREFPLGGQLQNVLREELPERRSLRHTLREVEK